jgi:uncharacterized membrane protein YqaE (UPF0057 family)
MKKSSLFIIMLICAGISLSSCSKVSNITITKRHYRSGFYVDLGGSHKQKTVKHPAIEPKRTAQISTQEIIPSAATAEPVPSSSDDAKDKSIVISEKVTSALPPFISSVNSGEKKQAHKKAIDNVYASTKSISTNKNEIQSALSVLNFNIWKENDFTSIIASGDASVPMWLMIVFAIILPPLAIGLKFGIVDKFWISCLLTLLFWIPGVIYAIYWVIK